MELGFAVKRRRVYSVEPSTIIDPAAFARKYVSYLVPALTKMKQSAGNYKEEEEEESDSLKKVVKQEVDMALVLSADQACAWSNALKLSLINGGGGAVSSSSSSSSPTTTTKCDQNPTAAADQENVGGEEDEKEAMRRLRRLVPGGEEICNDQEMLTELKSYVRCLQMQVNILQCLAHSHSF